MTERVIYSVITNGSDANALGGLIVVLLLGGISIFVTLRLRHAKRSGRALVSRSAQTTKLWNFLADRATWVVAAICCLAFAITIPVLNRYRADHNAIASGNYKTLVGTLDGYRIASVTRYHHARRLLDGIAGLDSTTLREQDAIIVKGRTFYVACNRPIDLPSPTIGNDGRCLALRAGQEVRIDFIETSDAGFRTEPLRISIVE
jgi:hypothetical protein